jgi:thiamine pyrophosphokinase
MLPNEAILLINGNNNLKFKQFWTWWTKKSVYTVDAGMAMLEKCQNIILALSV